MTELTGISLQPFPGQEYAWRWSHLALILCWIWVRSQALESALVNIQFFLKSAFSFNLLFICKWHSPGSILHIWGTAQGHEMINQNRASDAQLWLVPRNLLCFLWMLKFGIILKGASAAPGVRVWCRLALQQTLVLHMESEFSFGPPALEPSGSCADASLKGTIFMMLVSVFMQGPISFMFLSTGLISQTLLWAVP